jgi:hypothetical protein
LMYNGMTFDIFLGNTIIYVLKLHIIDLDKK